MKNKNIKIKISTKKEESHKKQKIQKNTSKIIKKINFFYKIITDTIIAAERYKTNDILSASELNLCIQNLENIYSELKNIENSLQGTNHNAKQIITKLQTINDDISLIFKTFGTSKIEYILTVCYGNDFIDRITPSLDKNKFDIIMKYVQPINYKIIQWKNKPKNKNISNKIIKNKIIEDFMIVDMGENIDCYDLCRTTNNFFTKVFGIKIVFQNEQTKNTIIINGVVTELLISCLNNNFIDERLETCLVNKPKDEEFNTDIFNKFINHLTIKELLIYNDKELYNRFVGYNNQAALIHQKSISQVIKEFINNSLFQQRKTLIILLLQAGNNECQYLAYLLYDLLSNEQNGNIDTFEQTILFDSFPWEIKKSFRLAMKNTIKYTKHLSQFDNSKIPIEQQICLMKASETIKEKAMIKLKEVKAKSEDSGSKARQYLEGLLKIPFGIYKTEFILKITSENSALINEIISKLKSFNIHINFNMKDFYTNIEITDILNQITNKIFNDIDDKNLNNCIKYFTSGKKDKLISNICLINSIIKRLCIKTKKLCHSGKKNEYMKLSIKNLLKDCKNNDKFMKELLTFNNSNIIDKNAIINNIKIINEKKGKLLTKIQDINTTLNGAIYGHNNAKRQLERVIGQWITGKQSGYCFGFEGPPGVGKTSLAKYGLSQCLKDKDGVARPFAFIALGGSSNGSTLSGHNYTYVGSTWGRIVDILMEKKCMNPIIFIDELDKVSRTEHGKEIIGILTHLIDSTQNENFQDKYFNGIDLDVSKILFVFSYNDVSVIDKILLDRIHRVKFDYLTINDKINIVHKYLLPEMYKNMGMDNIISFSDDNIKFIIDSYTNEAGVRKLKEIIFEIISEINLNLLKETTDINAFPIQITNTEIEKCHLKERHKIVKKIIHNTPQIGVINGLWANSLGVGGIIPIQCSYYPATNLLDLKLTGMQGDVMKESMNVAKTLAWNLTDKKTKNTFLKNNDKTKNSGLHIHCPEGAVPKDGPSAGTAITSAIFSLINNKKIKNDIAITGEINLQGCVTEIGGLELKILGGLKAGIKTFIFPESNLKDYTKFLEKFPDIDLSNIVFHPVKNITEVFKLIFV
uniref:Lon proteolytic domain-containing protein n=1 Tax=viral metagenome TaxID=1070528 RepID=A0A6C0LZ50_9ZZZZ